jgi:hypothetical protein
MLNLCEIIITNSELSKRKMSHPVDFIIDRAKTALHIKTDSALASYFGIKPNTVSAWRKRGKLNYEILFTKCENIHKEWLLTGEGEMYTKKDGIEFAQVAGAEFAQKAGEEFARPAGAEFAKPAGAEFARSAATEFAKPAGAEFARLAGSEFAQKALYRGADAAKSSVPEHSPPIHPPVNAQLTEVLSRLETLEQRYKAMDRTKPYFLLAIGRLLAVQEENISEGDLLIIDPCATPAKNDLIIIKTPEGTKISRHTSTDPALMGVVVKLIREYRQAE